MLNDVHSGASWTSAGGPHNRRILCASGRGEELIVDGVGAISDINITTEHLEIHTIGLARKRINLILQSSRSPSIDAESKQTKKQHQREDAHLHRIERKIRKER